MNVHKAGCNCKYCEHVKHCVLVHDELVEALGYLIKDIKDNFSGTSDIEYINDSYKKAKKALSKAKAK